MINNDLDCMHLTVEEQVQVEQFEDVYVECAGCYIQHVDLDVLEIVLDELDADLYVLEIVIGELDADLDELEIVIDE